MDSVFSFLFDAVASIIDIMDNYFVFSVGGFTFSLWDFEIACFVLCLIVPLLLITRPGPVVTSVSERIRGVRPDSPQHNNDDDF